MTLAPPPSKTRRSRQKVDRLPPGWDLTVAQRAGIESGVNETPRGRATTAARASGEALTRVRFNTNEFMKMIDLGIVEGRVELIDGEVFAMPGTNNAHSVATQDFYDSLRPEWPHPKFIRCQATHRFTEFNAYEPDLALLDSRPVRGANVDVLPRLVIEVSDTTLAKDLGYKRRDYARFGVPEYWVADVVGRVLHVFRGPVSTGTPAGDFWSEHRQLGPDDDASPLCIPAMRIRVGTVLPATGASQF